MKVRPRKKRRRSDHEAPPLVGFQKKDGDAYQKKGVGIGCSEEGRREGERKRERGREEEEERMSLMWVV